MWEPMYPLAPLTASRQQGRRGRRGVSSVNRGEAVSSRVEAARGGSSASRGRAAVQASRRRGAVFDQNDGQQSLTGRPAVRTGHGAMTNDENDGQQSQTRAGAGQPLKGTSRGGGMFSRRREETHRRRGRPQGRWVPLVSTDGPWPPWPVELETIIVPT